MPGNRAFFNQIINSIDDFFVPDDLHSSRRQLKETEVFQILERCYSVISESSKVLENATNTTATELSQRKPLSATTVQLMITSYLSRFLKSSIYQKIKRRQTRFDHNLFDVIWPSLRKTNKIRRLEEDINCGIIAPDFDVYIVFQEFMLPLLKDMHCLDITADFKPYPPMAYFPARKGESLKSAGFVFADESKLIQSCKVECSRNLDNFELPHNLSIGQIEKVERTFIAKLFNRSFCEAIGDNDSGSYYTLTEIMVKNSTEREMLNNYGLMIPLPNENDAIQKAETLVFHGKFWPYGRGVFVTHNLAIWINCQEHLRIIGTSNKNDLADIGKVYTRVARTINYLTKQLHFKESYLLGYLQSRPSYLGSGLKFTTILQLSNLSKELDNLRHLCYVRGLYMQTNYLSSRTVCLINMQSMAVFEYELFQDYCTAISNIISLEKDMSLSNSKHIASMLVKIFRRKKNSIADRS